MRHRAATMIMGAITAATLALTACDTTPDSINGIPICTREYPLNCIHPLVVDGDHMSALYYNADGTYKVITLWTDGTVEGLN